MSISYFSSSFTYDEFWIDVLWKKVAYYISLGTIRYRHKHEDHFDLLTDDILRNYDSLPSTDDEYSGSSDGYCDSSIEAFCYHYTPDSVLFSLVSKATRSAVLSFRKEVRVHPFVERPNPYKHTELNHLRKEAYSYIYPMEPKTCLIDYEDYEPKIHDYLRIIYRWEYCRDVTSRLKKLHNNLSLRSVLSEAVWPKVVDCLLHHSDDGISNYGRKIRFVCVTDYLLVFSWVSKATRAAFLKLFQGNRIREIPFPYGIPRDGYSLRFVHLIVCYLKYYQGNTEEGKYSWRYDKILKTEEIYVSYPLGDYFMSESQERISGINSPEYFVNKS